MNSKKGLWGGLIILIVIILVLVIIFGWGIPAVQRLMSKIPETGEKTLIKYKILPEEYYLIEDLVALQRGSIAFKVRDQLNTIDMSDDIYTTDFNPIVGYKVWEDKNQRPLSGVSAYTTVYIGLITDDNFRIGAETALAQLKKQRFNNTFVAVVPIESPISEPSFVHYKSATISTVPKPSESQYWPALNMTLHALPTARDILSIVLIITNRDDDFCKNLEVCEPLNSATSIFFNSNAYVYIVTDDIQKCNNLLALKMTNETVASVGRGDCLAISKIEELIKEIETTAATIKLGYEPLAAVGSGPHNITVQVIKRPNMGKDFVNIAY
ncbi:MAG: hypothetical protein QW063_00465 [Candidatus Nanoarchaeia archaeon]